MERLLKLDVNDSPSDLVYYTPVITHEIIHTDSFPKSCFGCNRIFSAQENVTQHFFCPWMGTPATAKKYQRILKYPPIAYSFDKKIYTPNQFAKELISAWETRYSDHEKWDFFVQLYASRLQPIRENIRYYLPLYIYQSLMNDAFSENSSFSQSSSETSSSSQASSLSSQASSQLSLLARQHHSSSA